MRITHIANITDVVSNNFDNDYDGISYLQIEVADSKSQNLIDFFPLFYWYLEDAYNSNLRLDYEVPDDTVASLQHNFDFAQKKETTNFVKDTHRKFDHIGNQTLKKVTMSKVLVHCQMGRSRSVTLVVMYLLYKQLVDVCSDFEFDH